ncbi:MAG: serpin family protein [Alphaproteobacteria bacterium]|nr:MAG: serpin family protein [Alphaproteobacteria bacterium]
MPHRKRPVESFQGEEFPAQEYGATLKPEVKNVIKLTLAFAKAVGQNQEDKAENLVVSPYNALAALSMVSKGAEGNTREELAQTLYGTDGKSLDKQAGDYAALNEAILKSNKGQMELTTANGVWTNRNLVELKDAFAADLKKTFAAEISGEDFADPATVKKINDWAAKNTNDLITKVLEKLEPQDAAILASALYFKGQWTHKFDKDETETKNFTPDGAKPLETPTMHQNFWGGDNGHLSYLKGKDYDAIAMTYGQEDAEAGKSPTMRIVFARPRDEDTPARDWLAGQAGQGVPAWLDANAFETAIGSVELPRLDIKQRFDLIPALKDMGVKQAFEYAAPGKPGADFSGMVKEGGEALAISKVQHDIVFKTDEEGSEAAAVTTIGMSFATSIGPMYPQYDMKLDRSFVFALQDVKSGAVLFVGAVNKPNDDMKPASKNKGPKLS